MTGIRDPSSGTGVRSPAIGRLLFVADAAVADVDELPRTVRAIIDDAAEVYVVTPTLPGRLRWLTDEVDQLRHVADERLDTVLGHMDSLGADASGSAGRGSVLTVVADAIAKVAPDHILLALRSPRHANWQERGLIEHIEKRFGLPMTTYAVDLHGHTSTARGPLLLCYDRSEGATHAIQRAGALFPGSRAIVVTAWQAPAGLNTIDWYGATPSTVNFAEFDRAAAESAGRAASEGVRVAEHAGLDAEAEVIEAAGPVWETILELAEQHDAATIVMGSRGLTGLRSMLLGSVSNAVAHHADRPTLIIPRPVANAER
jgi:nucleotide-binding universal stress UspA family protein